MDQRSDVPIVCYNLKQIWHEFTDAYSFWTGLSRVQSSDGNRAERDAGPIGRVARAKPFLHQAHIMHVHDRVEG